MAKVVIKRKMFNSHEFMGTLHKLAEGAFDGQTAYRINKIVSDIEQELKKTREKYLGILKAHADKDEKGEPKKSANPMMMYEVTEKKEELKKAEEALGEEDVMIDRPLLPVQVLGTFKLSAADVENLKGIVDFSAFEDKPSTSGKNGLSVAK